MCILTSSEIAAAHPAVDPDVESGGRVGQLATVLSSHPRCEMLYCTSGNSTHPSARSASERQGAAGKAIGPPCPLSYAKVRSYLPCNALDDSATRKRARHRRSREGGRQGRPDSLGILFTPSDDKNQSKGTRDQHSRSKWNNKHQPTLSTSITGRNSCVYLTALAAQVLAKRVHLTTTESWNTCTRDWRSNTV